MSHFLNCALPMWEWSMNSWIIPSIHSLLQWLGLFSLQTSKWLSNYLSTKLWWVQNSFLPNFPLTPYLHYPLCLVALWILYRQACHLVIISDSNNEWNTPYLGFLMTVPMKRRLRDMFLVPAQLRATYLHSGLPMPGHLRYILSSFPVVKFQGKWTVKMFPMRLAVSFCFNLPLVPVWSITGVYSEVFWKPILCLPAEPGMLFLSEDIHFIVAPSHGYSQLWQYNNQ